MIPSDWKLRETPNCLGTFTVFHGPHAPGPDNQICAVDTVEIGRLVSAAPDLLEACKRLLRLHYDHGTASLEGLESTKFAESAIAKATGGVL